MRGGSTIEEGGGGRGGEGGGGGEGAGGEGGGGRLTGGGGRRAGGGGRTCISLAPPPPPQARQQPLGPSHRRTRAAALSLPRASCGRRSTSFTAPWTPTMPTRRTVPRQRLGCSRPAFRQSGGIESEEGRGRGAGAGGGGGGGNWGEESRPTLYFRSRPNLFVEY